MERIPEPEVMASAEEAELYDAMDHSVVNDLLLDRLFALGGGGRILDLGTGPGHIPLVGVVRDKECRFVAVDLSQAMLDIAEEHQAVSEYGDRVEFRLADVKDMAGEADGSFDTVFSNSVLHHVVDPVAFLRELWRLKKTGGVALVRDLRRPESESEAMDLVAKHAAQEPKKMRSLFYASLLAAYTAEELEAFAKEAGWTDYRIQEEGDRHIVLEVSAAE